jgi:hypothetical protein
MYSKQEAGRLKQEFWTKFGQYMLPIPSSEGSTINWVNYKTGEKDIFFRMNADNKKATISIEFVHKDPDIQEIYYHHLESLKKVFIQNVGSNWIWKFNSSDETGRTVSKVYLERQDVSIYNKADWPALIEFFKSNLIALDQFWNEVKFGFEMLR